MRRFVYSETFQNLTADLRKKKKEGRGERKEGKKKWTEREEENGMPEKEERKMKSPEIGR